MKRRFIAGAVCPECQAQDTLAVEMLDGVPQERSCVKCGFSDSPPQATGAVPRGRLEKPNEALSETPTQVVRLFDSD